MTVCHEADKKDFTQFIKDMQRIIKERVLIH